MRWSSLLGSVGIVSLSVVGTLSAQSYPCPPSTPLGPPVAVAPGNGCYTPGLPTQPGTPYQPGTGQPTTPYSSLPGATPSTTPGAMPSTTTPGSSPFSAAPSAAAAATIAAAGTPGQTSTAGQAVGETGSASLASRAPQVIGDLVGGGFGVVHRSSSTLDPISSSSPSRIALAGRGAFKIAENETVRPTNRAFSFFNYFNGAGRIDGASGYDVYRNIFGFEKTFLDGNASFGIRSGYQQGSAGIGGIDGFSDTTFILKYAILNDQETGNAITGGLAVTAPFGVSPVLADGRKLESVLLQPYLGFIVGGENAYAQGFTSIVIPTESRDVTLYTADLALGYRIYNSTEDTLITQIIPTVEAHYNTALNHGGRNDLIYFPDQLTLTTGVHIGLMNRSYFTIAVGVPVVGPQMNDFEVIAQYNFRF